MRQNLQIFFIHRENNNPLVLYDIPEKEDKAQIFRENRVKGWFGSHPQHQDIQGIKESLYTLADKAVYSEVDDRSFFFRLIICIFSFLIVFFLTSYLLRDPLPLIDEVIIGALASVLVYILLVRRGRRSVKTEGQILQMRSHVDTIAFFEHEKLRELELILESLSRRSDKELLAILHGDNRLLSPSEEPGLYKRIAASLLVEVKGAQKRTLDKLIYSSTKGKRNDPGVITDMKQLYPDWEIYVLWKILDQENS